jgi:hypothetical protein
LKSFVASADLLLAACSTPGLFLGSRKPKEGAKLAYCISETLRQIEFVLNKNVETREFILDLKSVPFSKKTIDFCLQHPKQVQSYKVYCISKI